MGFFGNIHESWDGCLHAEGHFIGRDAGVDFGIHDELVAFAVELVDRFDEGRLLGRADAFGIADVMNGISGRVKFDSLMAAGEKARRPLAGSDGLGVASTDAGEDDEAGEVLGFRAEAVGDPGTHRGPTADRGAGVHEGVRRVVVDLLCDHGADDGDVVGHLGGVREEVADDLPALAILVELGEVALNFEFLSLELRDGLSFGEGGRHGHAVELIELGFVVEGLKV